MRTLRMGYQPAIATRWSQHQPAGRTAIEKRSQEIEFFLRCCRFSSCALVVLALCGLAASVEGAERLCDPSFEDCREPLIDLIRNETVGIDVGFWFMEDARYAHELIRKFKAGVPVRVLVDLRGSINNPLNSLMIRDFAGAGIPIRQKLEIVDGRKAGILHWKTMLFAGQQTVQFSAANYSPDAFKPGLIPYLNYVDEAIFFCDDPIVVNSFKTKYDDHWTNTKQFGNFANVGALTRSYPTFPIDSDLNFPAASSYASRALRRYAAETDKIDVVMYRITDPQHADAMIAARERGVPVRLLTEPKQYREPKNLWHSWNVDRMYAAGVEIKHRVHIGLNHQKSVLLYSQEMAIFGSSNWTVSTRNFEHNYFTKKAWIFEWFVNQFERKWNNTTGVIEYGPFVPLPPGRPVHVSPANLAVGERTSGLELVWNGGPFAHKYDVYFGSDPNPPLFRAELPLGPSATPLDTKKLALPTLEPGTTYYWRIVGRTMANKTKGSGVGSFTTLGVRAPAPAPAGVEDIVLWTADVPPTSPRTVKNAASEIC